LSEIMLEVCLAYADKSA